MNKYVEKVEEYYSKDIKQYHTIYHILELFEIYNKYKDSILNEFPNLNEEALFNAIAYHDSIYIIGCKMNEVYSAEVFVQKNRDINEDILRLTYDAILSTRIDNIHYDTDVERVLHDLDWNSFSKDYSDFKRDTDKIMYEATCRHLYTEKEVRKNQLDFYKSIVNKKIYITNTFSKFNDIAKHNLECRIKEIENE